MYMFANVGYSLMTRLVQSPVQWLRHAAMVYLQCTLYEGNDIGYFAS